VAYDTSVLDKAIAEKRVRLERKRRETLDRVLKLLDEHGPALGLDQAYVFGSVTDASRYAALSDVDVAVERITPRHFFQMMTIFSSALGCEVDVIELEKCHFAERIRREGIRWTKRD
jgi:hypothetical protein